MKKSTLAVATLLTALSAAPVMSVAYADEAPAAASQPACAGADGSKPACAGAESPCSGSKCAGGEHHEGGDE